MGPFMRGYQLQSGGPQEVEGQEHKHFLEFHLVRATWSKRDFSCPLGEGNLVKEGLQLPTGKACTCSCLDIKGGVRPEVSPRSYKVLPIPPWKKGNTGTQGTKLSKFSFIHFQFPSQSELSPAGFDRSLRRSVTGACNTWLHQSPPWPWAPQAGRRRGGSSMKMEAARL
jgi:hypothetical protein